MVSLQNNFNLHKTSPVQIFNIFPLALFLGLRPEQRRSPELYGGGELPATAAVAAAGPARHGAFGDGAAAAGIVPVPGSATTHVSW